MAPFMDNNIYSQQIVSSEGHKACLRFIISDENICRLREKLFFCTHLKGPSDITLLLSFIIMQYVENYRNNFPH